MLFPADIARGAVLARSCSAAGSRTMEAEVFCLESVDPLLHGHFLQFAAFVARVASTAVIASWGYLMLTFLR